MIRIMAIVATLALVAHPAVAGHCGGYTRTFSSHGTASYAQGHGYKVAVSHHVSKDYDVVFQKFLAVVPLAVYPSYSAVYAPAPPGAAPAPVGPAQAQQAQGELQQVLKGRPR